MPRKGHSDEDILKVLHEVEVDLSEGLDVPSACRKGFVYWIAVNNDKTTINFASESEAHQQVGLWNSETPTRRTDPKRTVDDLFTVYLAHIQKLIEEACASIRPCHTIATRCAWPAKTSRAASVPPLHQLALRDVDTADVQEFLDRAGDRISVAMTKRVRTTLVSVWGFGAQHRWVHSNVVRDTRVNDTDRPGRRRRRRAVPKSRRRQGDVAGHRRGREP